MTPQEFLPFTDLLNALGGHPDWVYQLAALGGLVWLFAARWAIDRFLPVRRIGGGHGDGGLGGDGSDSGGGDGD